LARVADAAAPARWFAAAARRRRAGPAAHLVISSPSRSTTGLATLIFSKLAIVLYAAGSAAGRAGGAVSAAPRCLLLFGIAAGAPGQLSGGGSAQQAAVGRDGYTAQALLGEAEALGRLRGRLAKSLG
jgi:hypothetical protein